MADIEQVRVYEISTTVSSGLNNNEICSETVLDSDLNYYMWCGKDNAGNVTKWLAKDENARVVDLTVSGEALFADGVYDVPSISFTSDPSSGFWTGGVGSVMLSIGGASKFEFTDDITFQDTGGIWFELDDIYLNPLGTYGLELLAGNGTDGAVLQLSTTETTVVTGHVLGRLNFAAPDETSGGDSIEVGASIVAIAEDDFYYTTNKTSLCFQTANSEVATTKMVLNSIGQALFKDGDYQYPSISFISDPTTGIWYELHNGSIMFSNLGYDSFEIDSGGQIILRMTGAGLWFDVNVTNLRPIAPYGSDGGLELVAGDTTIGSRLQLSTKETSIEANDVLGRINFAATAEASGGVAVEVGASIVAYAEDTFYYTGNKTSLSFLTSQSEGAGVKLTLNSAGNLCLGTQTTDSSAVGCLALANAVAPAAHTDNQIYIYSADVDCGTVVASLAIYTEHAVRTEYIETTRTLPVTVNGIPLMLLFGEMPV